MIQSNLMGHNGPPSPINEFQERFFTACEKLKRLGLKGELALSAGVVLVKVQGKEDSKPWRKAMRAACKKSGATLIETRPVKDFYVFTISTF